MEELPAFSFENDRNIKNYKNLFNNKSAFVEKNAQNYLRYIKRFIKPKEKNTFNTPYIYYQEKNNNTNYNSNYNELLSNQKNMEPPTCDDLIGGNENKKNISLDINKYMNGFKMNENRKINLKKNYFNNISKKIDFYNEIIDDENEREEKQKKLLLPSLSANEIFSIGNNEISDPSSYYKKYDEEYYRYRLEQKKYLDYNYKNMMNVEYQKHKKEPNINPYNPKYNYIGENKSNLAHNPIINPINHYGYNKYLRKDLGIRDNDKLKNLLNNYLNSPRLKKVNITKDNKLSFLSK